MFAVDGHPRSDGAHRARLRGHAIAAAGAPGSWCLSLAAPPAVWAQAWRDPLLAPSLWRGVQVGLVRAAAVALVGALAQLTWLRSPLVRVSPSPLPSPSGRGGGRRAAAGGHPLLEEREGVRWGRGREQGPAFAGDTPSPLPSPPRGRGGGRRGLAGGHPLLEEREGVRWGRGKEQGPAFAGDTPSPLPSPSGRGGGGR